MSLIQLTPAIQIYTQARQVFGNHHLAVKWLTKERNPFGGKSAIELSKSEKGLFLVKETLGQIDSGYFA